MGKEQFICWLGMEQTLFLSHHNCCINLAYIEDITWNIIHFCSRLQSYQMNAYLTWVAVSKCHHDTKIVLIQLRLLCLTWAFFRRRTHHLIEIVNKTLVGDQYPLSWNLTEALNQTLIQTHSSGISCVHPHHFHL